MSSLELLVCLLLVSLSGFMSASEVALFSLSRFQLRALKERVRPAHRKIKRLLSDPGGLLITILVTNEVINISLSTLITGVVSRNWGRQSQAPRLPHELLGGMPDWALQTVLGTLITAPLVLFMGEITPKAVAAKANQVVAPLAVGPLGWIYDGLKPIRAILKHVVQLVSRSIGRDVNTLQGEGLDRHLLKEEEFIFMVEEGHKEGAIRESELELIKNVFDLDDTRVSEVFTPMSRVHSLSAQTTIKGALSTLRGQHFSRVPVVGANRKQIIGILYLKDLLAARLDQGSLGEEVITLARKPLCVSPSMRLSVLFRKLKERRTHLAVVESVPGEAIGIVTMADVLDALLEDVLKEGRI